MSQETKKQIHPKVKQILKKYEIKGTLAVRNHRTLVLNIREGKIDFMYNYNNVAKDRLTSWGEPVKTNHDGHINVNQYWYHEHFDGIALEFLKDVMNVMMNGNWDESDIQTDYFDVGWYVDINIGQWDKPYKLK